MVTGLYSHSCFRWDKFHHQMGCRYYRPYRIQRSSSQNRIIRRRSVNYQKVYHCRRPGRTRPLGEFCLTIAEYLQWIPLGVFVPDLDDAALGSFDRMLVCIIYPPPCINQNTFDSVSSYFQDKNYRIIMRSLYALRILIRKADHATFPWPFLVDLKDDRELHFGAILSPSFVRVPSWRYPPSDYVNYRGALWILFVSFPSLTLLFGLPCPGVPISTAGVLSAAPHP